MGLQVGHQNVVSIPFVFEKGELLGLHGVLGDRSADHNKAMGSFPMMGLILKLSRFPAIFEFLETTSQGLFLDRHVELGHNGITTAFLVEQFDNPFPKEPESARKRIRDEDDG